MHQSPISRQHKIFKVGSDIVYSSKILGVIPDDQMRFNHMVNDTCKTCFFKLSKLKNLRYFLSHDMKIMLVKSLVISRLDYLIIAIFFIPVYIPKYLLNKLKRVLNASIKFILLVFQFIVVTHYYHIMSSAIFYQLSVVFSINYASLCTRF